MRNQTNSVQAQSGEIYVYLFAMLALSLAMTLFSGCGSSPTASADMSPAASPIEPALNPERSAPAIREIAIPSGTVLSIRLLQSISSASARSGDQFDGELAHALTVDGKEIFSKGTPILGRVVTAKKSGRLHNPGRLSVTLKAVQARNGEWIKLTSSTFGVQGKSHKKRNLTLIGGGGGVGALIGGIAGGGKGAAIGALSGAAAGTAGAAATGEKNVTLASERVLRFTLKEPVTIAQ